MSVDTLFEEFNKLNSREKKNFLDQVLDSFSKDTTTTSLTKEQRIEVENRINSILTGKAKTYSWKEVKTYATHKND